MYCIGDSYIFKGNNGSGDREDSWSAMCAVRPSLHLTGHLITSSPRDLIVVDILHMQCGIHIFMGQSMGTLLWPMVTRCWPSAACSKLWLSLRLNIDPSHCRPQLKDR